MTIGSVWQSHHTYDDTSKCSGSLLIADRMNDHIWIAECDSCHLEVGVHRSRLDGPLDVAVPDRTLQSHASDRW
jgi:hypothetical protein